MKKKIQNSAPEFITGFVFSVRIEFCIFASIVFFIIFNAKLLMSIKYSVFIGITDLIVLHFCSVTHASLKNLIGFVVHTKSPEVSCFQPSSGRYAVLVLVAKCAFDIARR